MEVSPPTHPKQRSSIAAAKGRTTMVRFITAALSDVACLNILTLSSQPLQTLLPVQQMRTDESTNKPNQINNQTIKQSTLSFPATTCGPTNPFRMDESPPDPNYYFSAPPRNLMGKAPTNNRIARLQNGCFGNRDGLYTTRKQYFTLYVVSKKRETPRSDGHYSAFVCFERWCPDEGHTIPQSVPQVRLLSRIG